MDEAAVQALKQFLGALAPLPEGEWVQFAPMLRTVKLSAGEAFLRKGEGSDRAAFVASGLLKAYYLSRVGDEFIRNFCGENSLAVALTAVLQGRQQSDVDFVALEPTRLVVFSYREYQSLLGRHWTWQQIGRVMAEKSYLQRERRQYELLTMAARARLEAFLEQFPGLAGRISQKDLAAYIGINPASLSRLRAVRGSQA